MRSFLALILVLLLTGACRKPPVSGDDTAQDEDTGTAPTCLGLQGTTYYVRSVTQCTGLVDVDYPGSGDGLDCALRHPMEALPPQGTSLLQGGDRLVIAPGSYAMGYDEPITSSLPGCESAYTWDCMMGAVPSGPSATQPTCIVGAGWNDGCSSPPELYAVERAGAVVDLQGSEHVNVECLEVTDHSDCVDGHTGGLDCPSGSNYPHGNYGMVGLRAEDAEDVTLRNLDIHGLPMEWDGRIV